MEKIKIYVRVEGDSRRHIFRVPSGITLETLLDRFGDKLGLEKHQRSGMRAAVFTPLGEPLDMFEIGDGAEVLIMKDALKDDIDYEGVE